MIDIFEVLLRPLIERLLDSFGVAGVSAAGVLGAASLGYAGWKLAWVATLARALAKNALVYGAVLFVGAVIALIVLNSAGAVDMHALLDAISGIDIPYISVGVLG